MFLFDVLAFRSRKHIGKILLMSGLLFLGSLSPPFGFLSTTCFVFVLKRDSSGSRRAHTPHCTFLVCFLFPCFFSPPLFICLFWPCVLSFLWFVGVPFQAPCVFAFLGFARNIGGLRSLAPSEALFLDARRHGCLWSIFSVVLVFPFCCFCGFFTQTSRVVSSNVPTPGHRTPGHRTCPAPK